MSGLHETHVCRECGAEITLLFVAPSTPEPSGPWPCCTDATGMPVPCQHRALGAAPSTEPAPDAAIQMPTWCREHGALDLCPEHCPRCGGYFHGDSACRLAESQPSRVSPDDPENPPPWWRPEP